MDYSRLFLKQIQEFDSFCNNTLSLILDAAGFLNLPLILTLMFYYDCIEIHVSCYRNFIKLPNFYFNSFKVWT